MQHFSLFSFCMDRKVEEKNSENNVNVNDNRFNANEFFRSFSRTNLCITQQDLYKYSRQCQDYFRSNCMCCNGKVTPEKVIQSKELNGTPIIPINLSPDMYVFKYFLENSFNYFNKLLFCCIFIPFWFHCVVDFFFLK